ncbi:MAG: PEP motif anchor domain-containing protein [Rhodocyclaceae bacterium]|nr:MAG: PEP motif anchor domain-containing protein [Rhodocyclaceae bacterium]
MKILRLTPLATLFAAGFFIALPAQAGIAVSYDLTRIGLTGDGYTDTSTGYQFASVSAFNGAGQVAGNSERYSGGSQTGQSAWLYNGSTTQAIGLTGSEYIGGNGEQESWVSALNAAGQVAGSSARYIGNTWAGYSAWLFNGSTTQQIGLTGAGYTSSTGLQVSEVYALNAASQVVGISQRYNGSEYTGRSAWLYNGSTTQAIGLTGNGYSNTSTGYQSSFIRSLNDAGQVAGSSERYNGSTYTGSAAWFYTGSTTQAIGLTGAGYTNVSTGYQFSTVSTLNAAGQVAGASQRFSGSTSTGQSAWLYNGGTTQAVGLTGTGYTNTSNGYQFSEVRALNASGQVAGTSQRFSGSTSMGQSAWLANGGTTQVIGLSGAGYTRNDGYENNWIASLNAAGQVLGGASRVQNGSIFLLGNAAWFSNGVTTSEIGLTGAAYARNDGYQHNQGSFLNEAGQVAGYAYRYNGSTIAGQSAWFYDDDLNQTFDLTFSLSSGGYANSSVNYLGNDGLVIGSFVKYSGATYLGNRAFAWTVQDGMVELGSLVDGGLSTDWSYLASAYRANGAGKIVGTGVLAQGGQGVFLLTPVPEPESYAMLLAGLGLISLVARRRTLA